MTQLVRDEEDLLPLILGCLMHDIGKGFGGDHSPKGAVLARQCLERLGADAELIETVVFLVREHLVMSHIAQRRDLSDPRLVLEFARTVGSRSRLRLLYLLTVVDIRASSKKAWTEWKGSLLQELFEKTSELLETGADDMERAMELFERRVETRAHAATEELRERASRTRRSSEFFDLIPQRYFISHTPTQIARHARVAMEHRPESCSRTASRRCAASSPSSSCTRATCTAVLERGGRADGAPHEHPRAQRLHDARRDGARGVPRRNAAGDEAAREMVWKDFLRSLERCCAAR
jgi:UTP:GlnB (protein PII) uridylyltransferase